MRRIINRNLAKELNKVKEIGEMKNQAYYMSLGNELAQKLGSMISTKSLLTYDKIKNALNFDIGKPEYSYVRGEIIMCLIYQLNQAAITFTNHYLEKHLKYKLIDYDSGIRYINDINEANIKFTIAVKKYGSSSMGNNIKSLFDFGLIDSNVSNKLYDFKNKFRNPYSHSDFRGIFNNETFILSQFAFEDDGCRQNSINVEVANFLMLHGNTQKEIADNEALNYFLEVDNMVCNYEISRHPELININKDNKYPNLS